MLNRRKFLSLSAALSVLPITGLAKPTQVLGIYRRGIGDMVVTSFLDGHFDIPAIHLPGHTPGHTGLMLSSNGEELFIWADIVHLGPIQFARPEATVPFDIDPAQAIETRREVFDMAATDRLEVAGAHIDFPSFGHVEKASEGVHFTPCRWDHTL